MARLNSCPSEEIESSWSCSLFRSDDEGTVLPLSLKRIHMIISSITRGHCEAYTIYIIMNTMKYSVNECTNRQ